MVQCDAIRSRAPGYPEPGAFPDPVTRVIDDERRQQFTAGRRPLRERVLPDSDLSAAGRGRREDQGLDVRRRTTHALTNRAQQILERFQAASGRFENIFGQLFQTERLKRLTIADDYGCLARAMTACCAISVAALTGNDHPIARCRRSRCYLNDLLACEDFCGGIDPRIGRQTHPRRRHRRAAANRALRACCAIWIRSPSSTAGTRARC